MKLHPLSILLLLPLLHSCESAPALTTSPPVAVALDHLNACYGRSVRVAVMDFTDSSGQRSSYGDYVAGESDLPPVSLPRERSDLSKDQCHADLQRAMLDLRTDEKVHQMAREAMKIPFDNNCG